MGRADIGHQRADERAMKQQCEAGIRIASALRRRAGGSWRRVRLGAGVRAICFATALIRRFAPLRLERPDAPMRYAHGRAEERIHRYRISATLAPWRVERWIERRLISIHRLLGGSAAPPGDRAAPAPAAREIVLAGELDARRIPAATTTVVTQARESIRRLVERTERWETSHSGTPLPSAASRIGDSGIAPPAAVEALGFGSPAGIVILRRTVDTAGSPSRPAGDRVAAPQALTLPSIARVPAASGETPSASVEVGALAEEVIRCINQRIAARRERLGRA